MYVYLQQIVRKAHCIDWASKKSSAYLIFILSVVSICVSVQLTVVSNKSQDLKLSTIILLNNSDRLVQKHDNLRTLAYVLPSSDIESLEVGLLKQTYQAYLFASGQINMFTPKEQIQERLNEVNTLKDYEKLIDKSIFETNESKLNSIARRISTLSIEENNLINLLIVIQIITAVLGLRIAYIE